MKRRNRFRIMVLAAVTALLVLIVAIFFIVRAAMGGLDSLALSPDFAEQELDINTDYTFTITADPEKSSLKSLEYVIDNTAATFSASEAEDGKAVLHTVSEGVVTICVKKSDVESNYLTFNIVDQAAKAAAEAQAQAEAEAQAAAEAEAQAAAEAEAAANATELVIATDNVRIRATPSTDGEVLATCKKGDSFTRTGQTEDGWSKIDYNGTEAYMKSEYLQVTTEEEIQQAKEQAEKEAEEKKKAAEETAATESTSTATDAATATAQAQADALAAANAAALEAAQAQAAAAAAQAAAGVPFTDKNGTTTVFTNAEWNYFMSYWDYTGQAAEMISHHTCAELRTLYNSTH